jgi:aspartate kinase
MKVMKFGGTSVGAPERMHSVARLISSSEPKVVVLSALSGTTNALVEISNLTSQKHFTEAQAKADSLLAHYHTFIPALYSTPQGLEKGKAIVTEHFDFIRSLINDKYTQSTEKAFLAEGELLSTQLFQEYLQEQGFNSALLPALSFMRIDADGEPLLDEIEKNINQQLEKQAGFDIYITQGFICINDKGETDNLKRGGSDYSASLIGAAIRSSEIQIWTDIDGMHNNDPRIVEKTFPIAELSFDEAAELAYFGAKILHPSTIWPAQKYNIPVRLLNTMQPEAKGTLITTSTSTQAIKAVAAKDGITAIKIKSTRMLLAYGFLRRVFEVFERYKTPIDMITTSEVAVSLTIDNQTYLQQIIKDLEEFGSVTVDEEQSIICLVGNMVSEEKGILMRVFGSLQDIPVRMVSYGGSKHNVSILVSSEYKKKALNALNKGLFFTQATA